MARCDLRKFETNLTNSFVPAVSQRDNGEVSEVEIELPKEGGGGLSAPSRNDRNMARDGGRAGCGQLPARLLRA